jgi:hypothetical protein
MLYGRPPASMGVMWSTSVAIMPHGQSGWLNRTLRLSSFQRLDA